VILDLPTAPGEDPAVRKPSSVPPFAVLDGTRWDQFSEVLEAASE
jgi:hypothetical protein